MKRVLTILIGILLTQRVQAQFTEIPTGTTAKITDLVIHADTLLLAGYPNYFAKYNMITGELVELQLPVLLTITISIFKLSMMTIIFCLLRDYLTNTTIF